MKKFYGYAFAAAAIMLASCSSDDAPEVNPVDDNAAGYISLSLNGLTNGTRADNDVNSVTYYFYKGNSPVSYSVVEDVAGKSQQIIKVAQIPDNVIAVVNSTAAYDGTLTGGDTFAKDSAPVMSSAVRYDAAGNETYKTSISSSQIFKTVASAKAASADKVITVNVDRAVAKVTVDASEVKVDLTGKEFDGYTIQFIPEYVYVNGVATETPVKKAVPGVAGNPLVASIQGADVPLTSLQHATGSTHWASTGFGWDSGKIKHYAIAGDGAAVKQLKQDEVQIFENCPSTVNGHNRDYTHIIVAGHYKLSGANAPAENADFWTFGSNNGKSVVYTSEAAVKEAMGGNANSKLLPIYGGTSYEDNGRNVVAYYLEGGNKDITCVKYGKGCVYYSAAIETAITDGDGEAAVKTMYGKGVVRNHHYILTVNTIKGFGMPIPDPNVPIIPEDPDNDPDSYYMHVKVSVNPFVKVDGQEVNWEN